MTDADLIRSLYVETVAEAEYGRWYSRPGVRECYPMQPPWPELDEWRRRRWLADAAQHIDALAAAGLLPVGADYRWVYEPDGTPLGYRERQLLTDWREEPAPCTGCGATERDCGLSRDGSRCCPACRHPLRRDTLTPATEGDHR